MRYRFKVGYGSEVQILEGKFIEITIRMSLLGILVLDSRGKDKSAPPVFVPWRDVLTCKLLG